MAKVLGVHRHTIRANIRALGMSSRIKYSEISDNELDRHVREFNKRRPDSGASYLMGDLTGLGLHIQRHRVREAQRRVDQTAVHLRNHAPIQRPKYKVKRPNALWCMDGYHKLVLYGFVIHGVVDAFSRKVNVIKKLKYPISKDIDNESGCKDIK